MIKVYQNLRPFNLSTSFTGKDGKTYMVDFKGYSSGRGQQANRAEFTTADEHLQEAIESDPRYGDVFVAIETIEQPTTDFTTNTGGLDTMEVSGVTNTQKAIEWLQANKEHKFTTPRPSKSEVLSVSTSYGVVFTDWK